MGYCLMYIYKNKFATKKTNSIYLHLLNAEVAQLVELQPSKLVVASSSLVFRSEKITSSFCWRFFYAQFLSPNSVPDSNSTGSFPCSNKRADKSPFNVIASPFTSSQLPSRKPKTAVWWKA
jgi:hypothetical protein